MLALVELHANVETPAMTAQNSPRSHHRLAPGLFRCKNDNAEYLISEYSFAVLRGGKKYDATEFRFDRASRHLTARAHIWMFYMTFSQNFTTIVSGWYKNTSTLQTYYYGFGEGERLFQRYNLNTGTYEAQEVSEPTLYHLNDDHAAFIFSETAFVVLMDGKVYNSISFRYDPSRRRVVARVHIWVFDIVFARDFSYVESGQYSSTVGGDTWKFGTAQGELLFQKVTDGKLHGVLNSISPLRFFDVFFPRFSFFCSG